MKNKSLKGYLYALLGATFWGLSGTCASYLMNTRNIPPLELSTYRMLIAGSIMFLYILIKDGKEALKVFTNLKDTLVLFSFSIFGMASMQVTYLITISYTNAATATVLEYTGIVMIVVLVCVLEARLPLRSEGFSIVFAILGTFFLATRGNIHTLVISNEGLFYGALSAISLMIYTLAPPKLLKKYGTINITALATFISGIMISFISKPKVPEEIDTMIIVAFIGLTLFGTIISYTLYFEGLAIIGPVKTSLIACVEPISALLFSMALLGEKFVFMDFVGIMCILFAVAILSLKDLVGKGKVYAKVE